MSSNQFVAISEDIFATIGRFTLSWGMAEAGIDMAVLIVYRDLGGRTVERDLPRNLDGKLNFLKKAAKKLPVLAPFRERLVGLRALVAPANEARQDIVHSFAVAFGDGSAINGVRFLRETTEWKAKHVSLDVPSLTRVWIEATFIADQTLALGEELVEFSRTYRTTRAARSENNSPEPSPSQSIRETAETTGSDKASACPSEDGT